MMVVKINGKALHRWSQAHEHECLETKCIAPHQGQSSLAGNNAFPTYWNDFDGSSTTGIHGTLIKNKTP